MQRIRLFLTTLMMVAVLGILHVPAVSAQSATPIAIPTVTTTGCDQVPAYAEARQQIMNELIDGIAAVFPAVPTPITEHGDVLAAAILSMNPDQTKKLAELYDEIANKIEKIDAPEIAVFYDDQVVELYRLSAKTFLEIQKTDFMTAGQMYGEQLGATADAIDKYGKAAAAACPAFSQVIEVDQTKIGF